MQYLLMKRIFEFLIENKNEFNLHNAASKEFHDYIYLQDGNFRIGGEVVGEFIGDSIKLINKGARRD